MITYRNTADAIKADQLRGFFVEWPVAPSPQRHLEILRGSHAVELALDADAVVGFVTAIGDDVMSAFIPRSKSCPSINTDASAPSSSVASSGSSTTST